MIKASFLDRGHITDLLDANISIAAIVETALGNLDDAFTRVFNIAHDWIIVDRTVNCKYSPKYR